MLTSYPNEFPANIRKGDLVVLADGREFQATATPELVLGDYHVNGYTPDNHLKSFTMEPDSPVTISYEEDDTEDYGY